MSEPTDVPDAVPARPLLRVVGGEPTAEEVAALVAVLTAAGAGDAAPAPERWSEDMSDSDKAAFMNAHVVPAMAPIFQAADPDHAAEFENLIAQTVGVEQGQWRLVPVSSSATL